MTERFQITEVIKPYSDSVFAALATAENSFRSIPGNEGISAIVAVEGGSVELFPDSDPIIRDEDGIKVPYNTPKALAIAEMAAHEAFEQSEAEY